MKSVRPGVSSRLKRNVYCARKAALIGLARASALDLGPYGTPSTASAPAPSSPTCPPFEARSAKKGACPP
ncbi:MAG: 3-oxoacyl-ACP reductase [Prosthecobacter sp.]|nr:3-oxoacyl-ACP reductase [Prosthecobacter sp.]